MQNCFSAFGRVAALANTVLLSVSQVEHRTRQGMAFQQWWESPGFLDVSIGAITGQVRTTSPRPDDLGRDNLPPSVATDD